MKQLELTERTCTTHTNRGSKALLSKAALAKLLTGRGLPSVEVYLRVCRRLEDPRRGTTRTLLVDCHLSRRTNNGNTRQDCPCARARHDCRTPVALPRSAVTLQQVLSPARTVQLLSWVKSNSTSTVDVANGMMLGWSLPIRRTSMEALLADCPPRHLVRSPRVCPGKRRLDGSKCWRRLRPRNLGSRLMRLSRQIQPLHRRRRATFYPSRAEDYVRWSFREAPARSALLLTSMRNSPRLGPSYLRQLPATATRR